MFYKFTAAWGGHEGSMLLWITVLAIWTLAVAAGSRSQPDAFASRVLGVLGIVSSGIIAFSLLTSNPFIRLTPPAFDGNDLNPLLQDPGMIIHPPTLYVGYVGMAVPFAFAVAALLTGRLDKNWAKLDAAVDDCGLDVPHMRHHARQLVVVLRARLGRLVVLGSRRELLVHAVAHRDRVAAFAGGDGAARHLQELDRAARDRGLSR